MKKSKEISKEKLSERPYIFLKPTVLQFFLKAPLVIQIFLSFEKKNQHKMFRTSLRCNGT